MLKGKNLLISLFQVNYYERSLEQMRQSMELERKDICQTFKVKTLASAPLTYDITLVKLVFECNMIKNFEI